MQRAFAHMRAFLTSRDVLTFCFFCILSGLIWLVHQRPAEQAPVVRVEVGPDTNAPINYTEKSIMLPLITRGVPEGETMLLFTREVQIKVRVPEANYRNVTADDFQAICTYPTNGEEQLKVEVSCSEPYVEIVHISPDLVDYLIQ